MRKSFRLPPISVENPVAQRVIIHTLFSLRPYCHAVDREAPIRQMLHQRQDYKALLDSENTRRIKWN